MGKLIYAAITSLDGFVADEAGNFDWAAPDEEVHAFVNEQERPVGTYLYGRRMYEVMTFWETMPTEPDESAVARDYADIWRSADKVVFSSTLTEVASARTRIDPVFDADVVRRMKAESPSDLSVGGPTLAAAALRAGLVDEIGLYLNPVIVGAGNPALPAGVRLNLELTAEHRFANGVVYLHHRTTGGG